MRKLVPYPVAVLCALCVLCGESSPAAAQLLAGASRVSITPDPKAMPYTLGGYGDPGRFRNKAAGIHDACYARALVLAQGAEKLAVVSLDLCFMPANVKDEVLSRIVRTGIKARGLFLSCTHTHSGPEPLELHAGNTPASGEMPSLDQKLLGWMADHIAQAIVEANDHLKPSGADSRQMGKIGLNRNRRGEKLTDDEMTVLHVAGDDGKPIADVVNYAAHPVYYGADNLRVSGDWSGAFQRMLEGVTGGVVLFVNGAEGDASPNGSDEGTPAEKIEVYAAKLMQPTQRLIAEMKPSPNVKLGSWLQTVELGARQPHNGFLIAALLMKATADQARALVDRMMPEKAELTFVQIGNLLLMGFPGEPTTPVGLEAKRLAKEKGWQTPAVVALTNGWLGYLVTAEQYAAGKYEPTMSFYGPTIGHKMLTALSAGLAGHMP